MLSLIKFYADWCTPCTSMLPVMDQLKEELKDDVVFTDVNIEDNPQLRAEHHVRSIPTFLIFKDGIEIGRKNGSGSYAEMKEWIIGFRDLQPEVLLDTPGGETGPGRIVLRDPSEQDDAGA